MEISSEFKNPVLHVVVVAFHHKKGCQVIMVCVFLLSALGGRLFMSKTAIFVRRKVY